MTVMQEVQCIDAQIRRLKDERDSLTGAWGAGRVMRHVSHAGATLVLTMLVITLLVITLLSVYSARLEERRQMREADAEEGLVSAAMLMPPTEPSQMAAADKLAWTALRCRIVHYCECDRCTGKRGGDPAYGITATGTQVTEGRTVAVDPEVIPLGSELRINGHSYTAEDTGVHGATVDIYVPDHEQALEMGTYETVVLWR